MRRLATYILLAAAVVSLFFNLVLAALSALLAIMKRDVTLASITTRELLETRSETPGAAGSPGRRTRPRLLVGFIPLALLSALLAGATGASAHTSTASDSLVTLSGVVSDASGPVAGTIIGFNSNSGSSVSTVTDANGSYTLHVVSGDAGQLSFRASDATAAPLPELTAQSGSLSIGTSDLVENLMWPAHAQVRMTVVDATSTPVAGAGVARLGSGDVQGTLSSGDAVTFSYSYPQSEDNCTTDAAGQCLFSSLVGATPGFYSLYQLVPGDSSYPLLYVYAYPLVTADPTDSTIALSGAGLVTLSGVVSDASGPAAGTIVGFNSNSGASASTVTGADGSYTLHVVSGDAGQLSFRASDATAAPLPELTAQSGSLSIGTSDLVANFVWPAHAQVRTTVVDATSTPLPGAGVTRLGSGDVQGTLSNGTAITVSYSYPQSEDNCTTDAAGQCLFSSLVGATPGFYSLYQQVPGDPSYPFLYVYVYPSVTTDPTDSTIALSGAGLVTLSGVVSDASGPAAGTIVGFNSNSGASASTVTAADGSYVLHVVSGDAGQLSFRASDATAAPLPALTAQSGSLAIGTSDVVANFVWPAHAQVRTTVVDATSTPLAGAGVARLGSGDVQGTLSNGTAITVSYSYPQSEDNCTSDAAGQCLFSSLVGATPGFYSMYQLVPGDPSYPLIYVYVYPSVTTDPTDSTIAFLNLASFASAGSATGSVAIGSPDGTSISDLSNQSVPGNALPSGAQVLTGALSYQVSGLTPGGSADVTLVLPAGSNPTSVYKLQGGVYVDLSSIATIVGDTVTLHLTDGVLPGDSDGLVNGIITDPLILSRAAAPAAPTNGPVTAENASASVSFTAPAKDGGSPILDYTATCSSSNGGASGSTTGSGSPLLVAGLTNGSAYTCAVTARNVAGSSSPSATSNSFSPSAAAAPQISKFAPPKGPAGTSVTISGSGFVGATAVKFHGTNAQSFIVNSATKITAVVASGSTSGMITVSGPGGTVTSAQAFAVTPPPKPQILGFSPEKGPVGTTVTIIGFNFTGATAVKFHGMNAQSFSINSATKITAVVASGSSSGAITVTGPGGTVTSLQTFAVTPPPKPQILGFSPPKGPAGTILTIAGFNFTGVTAVKFHGTNAQSFTVNSDTKITAVVASGSTSGTITVTGPGGTATSAKTFAVTKK